MHHLCYIVHMCFLNISKLVISDNKIRRPIPDFVQCCDHREL